MSETDSMPEPNKLIKDPNGPEPFSEAEGRRLALASLRKDFLHCFIEFFSCLVSPSAVLASQCSLERPNGRFSFLWLCLKQPRAIDL